MIEQVLIFSFGVLTAALIWLLLLPAFWRRATRLARQAIERGLPLTPNEIAAEQDRLRAERSIELGRLERAIEQARKQAVTAKSEVGERLRAERGFLDTIEQGREKLADVQSKLHTADGKIEALTADLATMTEARERAAQDIFRLETQRDALTKRLNEAVDLGESRRIRIDELEQQLQAKIDALREETMRATNLRLELQTAEIHVRESRRELAELTTLAARRSAETGETAPEPSPATTQDLHPQRTRKAASVS
jgi:chromosome segregation ATPase